MKTTTVSILLYSKYFFGLIETFLLSEYDCETENTLEFGQEFSRTIYKNKHLTEPPQHFLYSRTALSLFLARGTGSKFVLTLFSKKV